MTMLAEVTQTGIGPDEWHPRKYPHCANGTRATVRNPFNRIEGVTTVRKYGSTEVRKYGSTEARYHGKGGPVPVAVVKIARQATVETATLASCPGLSQSLHFIC